MTRSFVSLQSVIKAAKNAEGKYKTNQTRFVVTLWLLLLLFSALETLSNISIVSK